MKKGMSLAVVFVFLVSASVASAQSRVGPPVGPPKGDGVGPMSLFDVTGEENAPSGITTLGDCTSVACDFASYGEKVWARNIRYGTLNCKTDFNNTFFTVFDYTFTPTPGAQYLGISFTSQAAISNHNSSSVVVGLAMECTVFQGSGSIPCPGTTAQPFLTRQNNDTAGHRTGNLGFASYHGMIRLGNDRDPVQVRVRVRTSDTTNAATGAMCYTYVELTQYTAGF